MKTLVLSLFSFAMLAQNNVVPYPRGPGGGGGATCGTPDCIVSGKLTVSGPTTAGTTVQTFEGFSAPTLATPTTHGAAGSTSYSYCAAFKSPVGNSICSPLATIATGNAVLDGTNYNVLTAPICSTARKTVDLFVSTAAGNIAHRGWIANVACGATYNHQGQDGSDEVLPIVDTSPGVYESATVVGSSSVPSFFRDIGGGTTRPQLVVSATDRGVSLMVVGPTSDGPFSFPSPYLMFGAFRNTADAPAAVHNGDDIGTLDAFPFDGAGWANAPVFVRNTVDGIVTASSPVPVRTTLTSQADSFTGHDLTLRAPGQVEIPSLTFSGIATIEAYVNAPVDGSIFYCSDCQVTTVSANVVSNATCKNGGNGSFAKRVNGVWKCEYTP